LFKKWWICKYQTYYFKRWKLSTTNFRRRE